MALGVSAWIIHRKGGRIPVYMLFHCEIWIYQCELKMLKTCIPFIAWMRWLSWSTQAQLLRCPCGNSPFPRPLPWQGGGRCWGALLCFPQDPTNRCESQIQGFPQVLAKTCWPGSGSDTSLLSIGNVKWLSAPEKGLCSGVAYGWCWPLTQFNQKSVWSSFMLAHKRVCPEWGTHFNTASQERPPELRILM